MAGAVALDTESRVAEGAFIRLSFAMSVLMVLNVAKLVGSFGAEKTLKLLRVSACLSISSSSSDVAIYVDLKSALLFSETRLRFRKL